MSRRGLLVRVVLLALLVAANFMVPLAAREGCDDCVWCTINGQERTCCEDTQPGGWSSCSAHYDSEHGWHCDVGTPCPAF
jgi:hypothetical protein